MIMEPLLIATLVIAMITPPIVVALFGKPLQVLLNIILTAFGILPGIAHAIFVLIDRNQSGKASTKIGETVNEKQ